MIITSGQMVYITNDFDNDFILIINLIFFNLVIIIIKQKSTRNEKLLLINEQQKQCSIYYPLHVHLA